jgi:class 3 adenylate cyclase
LRPKLKGTLNKISSCKIDFNFIGIHVGKVIIVRGGIRGENNNDLVWVGNATNKAVKLSDMAHDDYPIHVSDEVYKKMLRSVKYTVRDGVSTHMWSNHGWEAVMDGMVSSSSWWIRP